MPSPSPSRLIFIMNDLGTKVGKTLCSRFVLDLVWNRKGTMYHKIGILLEQSVNRNMHGTDGEQGGNVQGTILDFSFHLCSGLTSSWSTPFSNAPFSPYDALMISHAYDFLQIRNVSRMDEGWYDCQVNTEPKISNMSYLFVLSPSPPPPPPPRRRWNYSRGEVQLEGDGGPRWRGPDGGLRLRGPPTKIGPSRASTSSVAAVRPRKVVAVTFPDVMVATQPGNKKAFAAASTDGE